MKKKRLDLLLLEQGLALSRERAQALILGGKVLVNENPAIKAGHLVALDSKIRLRLPDHPYVSRGGLKLEAAICHFNIQVAGKIALDIGASTGGFSHVLLLQGVEKIFAIDVGINQMDWKIRSDPRVILFEKTNARTLSFKTIGKKVDLIVVDVSFISLHKILPALLAFTTPLTEWVTLIKPQFEVGRDKVSKGGIVHSEEARQEVVLSVKNFCKTIGLACQGLIESPILGAYGNKEYLAHWKHNFSLH